MGLVGVVMLLDVVLLVGWQISDPLVIRLFTLDQQVGCWILLYQHVTTGLCNDTI